jgi:hypothetical protein
MLKRQQIGVGRRRPTPVCIQMGVPELPGGKRPLWHPKKR